MAAAAPGVREAGKKVFAWIVDGPGGGGREGGRPLLLTRLVLGQSPERGRHCQPAADH